jgi:hypothetical protein
MTTSSCEIPRSGRAQYGTPFATSFRFTTVLTLGGNAFQSYRALNSTVLGSGITSIAAVCIETLHKLPPTGLNIPGRQVRLHRRLTQVINDNL